MTHVEMERFIAEYGSDIYSFCCCLTGSRQEADDLYQETFLRAVEKQKHLDMSGSPKSYLLSVAVYLWKNQRRKVGWRRRIADTEYYGREDTEMSREDSSDDLPEPVPPMIPIVCPRIARNVISVRDSPHAPL